MIEIPVLQLMDEIEMRHGVNEDRWGILLVILEKQAEQQPAQPAGEAVYECPHLRTTTMPSGKLYCVACQEYI